jgi:carbon-monoxide dehydrogenase iron sulfur subunit
MVTRLVVREELCTGCRACQVACVARHEGLFGVYTSRLRIIKDEPLGTDRPQVCRLCGRAPCVAACPTGALHKDEATSAVILNTEACTGCAQCLEACPFGVIGLHPQTHVPLICDLCAGQPACVQRCPTGAISYGDLPPESHRPPAMHLVRPDPASVRMRPEDHP